MSRIRSLPKFCIGLSAAALLTLGLAGQAQSESRYQSLSSIQATFQGLVNAIREHQNRLEEEKTKAEAPQAEEPQTYQGYQGPTYWWMIRHWHW